MVENRIRELRRARGWTQELLAAKLGTSRYTLYEWEVQNSQPSAEYIFWLLKLFECSYFDLFHQAP